MADMAYEIPPRLYVSGPSDLELRPLLDGLKRRGADPYVLSDVAPLGADIVQSLRVAIARADRVLIVLTRAPALNSVLEAGIALALGKPLLIIAAPGSSTPSHLKGQLITQAQADDLDAINFALDHAEAGAALRDRRGSVPRPTGRPLGQERAQQLLARLSRADPSQIERASVDVLLEAIEASRGVGAVNAEPRPDSGRDAHFDLGVWIDDLEAIGGNPLLVEVKRTVTPGAVEQVLRALDAHPTAQVALLVYVEPSPRAELGQARFPVLAVSVQELLERMAVASFAEVLVYLRNRSAHGLEPS
jgi:hypothetical protein